MFVLVPMFEHVVENVNPVAGSSIITVFTPKLMWPN